MVTSPSWSARVWHTRDLTASTTLVFLRGCLSRSSTEGYSVHRPADLRMSYVQHTRSPSARAFTPAATRWPSDERRSLDPLRAPALWHRDVLGATFTTSKFDAASVQLTRWRTEVLRDGRGVRRCLMTPTLSYASSLPAPMFGLLNGPRIAS